MIKGGPCHGNNIPFVKEMESSFKSAFIFFQFRVISRKMNGLKTTIDEVNFKMGCFSKSPNANP